MKRICNLAGWFFLPMIISFVTTVLLPFFGHAVVGMAFGGWSCLRVPPSLLVASIALTGCLIGSIFGGLFFSGSILLVVLFGTASIVGFVWMYSYTLKIPTQMAFPH